MMRRRAFVANVVDPWVLVAILEEVDDTVAASDGEDDGVVAHIEVYVNVSESASWRADYVPTDGGVPTSITMLTVLGPPTVERVLRRIDEEWPVGSLHRLQQSSVGTIE